MYPAIPGWDVVVMLPTCVLAERYLAFPGRDVAGLLPYEVSKSALVCCYVSSLSYLFYQYGGIIYGDEASFPIYIDMRGSSRAMKLPFSLIQI